MNQEKSVECSFSPIPNFSEFQGTEDPFLYDCTLLLDDNVEIKSHAVLLANSSIFFENAFTSGMDEDINRKVTITFNPQNAFPLIMPFFYTGCIEIDNTKLIPMLAIARFYGIQNLETKLQKIISDAIAQDYLADDGSRTLIIDLIQQCYADNLSTELQYLFPYVACYLDSIGIDDLSKNLDVESFCNILSQYNGKKKKQDLLRRFIGDYQCTEDEQRAIMLFNQRNPF